MTAPPDYAAQLDMAIACFTVAADHDHDVTLSNTDVSLHARMLIELRALLAERDALHERAERTDCHICHHDPEKSLLCSACSPRCPSCRANKAEAALAARDAECAELKRDAEIRRNDDGTLDEVVAPRFHLEQMSNTHWWMAVECEPHGRIHVNLSSRTKITASVEDEREYAAINRAMSAQSATGER